VVIVLRWPVVALMLEMIQPGFQSVGSPPRASPSLAGEGEEAMAVGEEAILGEPSEGEGVLKVETNRQHEEIGPSNGKLPRRGEVEGRAEDSNPCRPLFNRAVEGLADRVEECRTMTNASVNPARPSLFVV
jgi:hypothetical protein